jgi:serine/threonine protein kinase
LPYDNALYGKGLRRLRTLCGRTSKLPAICEVEDTFEHSNVAIAQTGISDVYRAVNAQNRQQVVALKRIRDNATSVAALKRVSISSGCVRRTDTSMAQVWRKEAIVWQLLRHPHIVPFLGILRQESSLQLVSTWMAHGQLTQYIKAHPEESPLRFVRSFTVYHDRTLTHRRSDMSSLV